MTYELINPSDQVTFEAENDQVAAAAAALVGQGAYGARREGWYVGGFAFGKGEELRQLLGGISLEDFVDIKLDEVQAALRSFRYVSERSSLTRICHRAHVLGRGPDNPGD